MMTKTTMQKECVIIVTTNMGELRSLGIAHIANFMQLECVKTATSTIITVKEGRVSRRMLDMIWSNLRDKMLHMMNEIYVCDKYY